jgi:hypothetical protein
MNIEEARKVLWLKTNPRPLGELLDEGLLTKENLEWAAQWAYNIKLKEAAQVLLEGMKASPTQAEFAPKPEPVKEIDKAIPVNMPMEKARTVTWPFAPYKGQSMGVLVDSKQLSLKDLGYAVENAWDEKVKQAAITLSLVRLEQVVKEPAPEAGFVHVVSGGRSYSEQRQYRLTLYEGVVIGLALAVALYLVSRLYFAVTTPNPNARSITEFFSSPAQLIVVLVLFVLLLAGGYFLASIPERITERLEKQIEEHRLGQEGEDNVVQTMIQALDGNWHLFRNITLPGRNKGDLDVVLMGPPGVWLLEIKNYRGVFRNAGDAWEIQRNGKWKPAITNPGRQAVSNAVRLANFLKADGLNVFVNSVVVWANMTSPLHIENPSVAVWRFERLADELGNIWQAEKLSSTEREKIVEKLNLLCERQKASK